MGARRSKQRLVSRGSLLPVSVTWRVMRCAHATLRWAERLSATMLSPFFFLDCLPLDAIDVHRSAASRAACVWIYFSILSRTGTLPIIDVRETAPTPVRACSPRFTCPTPFSSSFWHQHRQQHGQAEGPLRGRAHPPYFTYNRRLWCCLHGNGNKGE